MRDGTSLGIFFFKAFLVSLVIFGFSSWQSNKVPTSLSSLNNLRKEPLQIPTTKKSFTTQANGNKYQIDPVFDYELWGLVVADHNSDSWLDNVHASWGDYINTKDICVIWGSNVVSPYLKNLDFTHGSFTCYVSTKSSEAWQSFNKEQLSNNHLIPANKEIESLIRKSQIGDEIRIKGQLVNYNVNGGPFRNSSTVRTDMENGACEIIYVEEFETLARNNKMSFQLLFLTKITTILFLLAAVGLIFIAPFFTNREH